MRFDTKLSDRYRLSNTLEALDILKIEYKTYIQTGNVTTNILQKEIVNLYIKQYKIYDAIPNQNSAMKEVFSCIKYHAIMAQKDLQIMILQQIQPPQHLAYLLWQTF